MIKSLLWGKPGHTLAADFAQRSAGKLRFGAADVCGKPHQWLLPDITVSESSTSTRIQNVRDREVFWSERQQTEPRCFKCGTVTQLKWNHRMSQLRAEFWCAQCGGKVRGMGRNETEARADSRRRMEARR